MCLCLARLIASSERFLDQLFSAAKGHGAFLNETTRLPLVAPPPALTSISQALIGIECESIAPVWIRVSLFICLFSFVQMDRIDLPR